MQNLLVFDFVLFVRSWYGNLAAKRMLVSRNKRKDTTVYIRVFAILNDLVTVTEGNHHESASELKKESENLYAAPSSAIITYCLVSN